MASFGDEMMDSNQSENPQQQKKEEEQQQQQAGQKRRTDGNAVKEKKRRKWQAKQEAKAEKARTSESQTSWFRQNSHYALNLTTKEVDKLKSTKNTPDVVDLAHSLVPYTDLQSQDGPSTDPNVKRWAKRQKERLFIAEGTETVRLLIQQSTASMHKNENQQRRLPPMVLKSVFIKTSTFFERPSLLQNDVEQAAKTHSGYDNEDGASNEKWPHPPFRVLVGSEEVQSKVVRYPFCRGALACGLVPSWSEDETWLMEFLKSHPRFSLPEGKAKIDINTQNNTRRPLRLLALDGICDTANLGAIVRSASAFGLDAIILSKDCCDVWYRRAVRVSMGHCCRIPCVRVPNLSQSLQKLKDELGVKSYAAVIDLGAECVLENIGRGNVPGAWCCVMGNEGRGISKPVAQTCSTRIRIDMEDGVDSLSVPIATAILLHGLKEREAKHDDT